MSARDFFPSQSANAMRATSLTFVSCVAANRRRARASFGLTLMVIFSRRLFMREY